MSYLTGVAQRWWVVGAALTVWQVATTAADDAIFPSPWQIAPELRDLFVTTTGGVGVAETVGGDILPSLARALTGWTIAIVLGVAAGTALGRSRTGMQYAGALLAFLRVLPTVAVLPVFLELFGLTPAMSVAVIGCGSIWPILLNTVDGVRSVDPVQTDTARSFRTPRVQWITLVVLPAAAPKIVAGLRISLGYALILMVISETVGSTNGIGYQLMHAKSRYDITLMWAWMLLLGILGYALNLLLHIVERRVLQWQPAHSDARQRRSRTVIPPGM